MAAKKWRWYAWAAAAGLGLGLVVMRGSHGRFGPGVAFFGAVLAMVPVAIYDVQERRGWRRHTRFVAQWPAELLAHAGFRVEALGDYRGLKGTRQGYVVRVYHDPGRSAQGLEGETLCVMIYYTPPRRPDGNWDVKRIHQLQNQLPRYEWITLDPFIVEYRLRYLCGRTPARWDPRWEEILSAIDRVIDVVVSYGLEPLEEAAVDQAVEREDWNNGPEIETFQRRQV